MRIPRRAGDNMITLDDKVRGIWFASLIPGEQDFLACLTKDENGFHILYRFKYYDGTKYDKKNWYEIKTKKYSEEEMIAKIRTLLKLSVALTKDQCFIELLRGNTPFEEFAKQFINLPFFNVEHHVIQ